MTTPFVTVVGVAAVGDPVDVTPRTAEHLKANGWTAPVEEAAEPLDCTGLLMHSIDPKTDECTWCDMPRAKAEQERCPIWFDA